MSEKQFYKPTEAELEILRVLWDFGANSVRFVNEKLNEQREIGYTTTLKLMQIMHEKGLVVRNTDTRSHIYEAALPKEETQRNLLENFVDNVFSGSASNLVMQALGSGKTSLHELAEIKALIAKIEAKQE
jgi:predicted transcriptional regulator